MKSECSRPGGYLQTWLPPSCQGPGLGPCITLGPPWHSEATAGPGSNTPYPCPDMAPTCGPSLSPSSSPGAAQCWGWGCHGAPGCLLLVRCWDKPWLPELTLRLPYIMTGCNCASLCVNGTFTGIQILCVPF